MKIIVSLTILIVIVKIFIEVGKLMGQNRILEEFERGQTNFNHYQVLPHKVKELRIHKSNDGRYNLTFTPTNIKQIDESLFLIGVKAIHNHKYIAFDLIINSQVQKINDLNSDTSEFNIVELDTNQEDSDGLLEVLARLFNVEISNKSQIVRSVEMATEKFDINIESIRTPRHFTAYFTDNKSPIISPALDFFIDIEKGEVTIQEIDKLFRPIIVNKLTYKSNIKS